MADIFISYKREDRARIAPLARALEARGYTVWWDLELIAGQKWGKKIKAELDAAKCVVVAWTTNSVAADQTYVSEWVENEADTAHRRGVLVPALFDPGRIAWTHQKVQYATLTGWNGESSGAGFDDLMAGVELHAGARARPQDLELAAWQTAERAETAEAFRAFFAAHPQSRFAEIARGRIAELDEVAAWSALGAAPTIAALAGFLRRFPAGRFADEAEARIRAMELAGARAAGPAPPPTPQPRPPEPAPPPPGMTADEPEPPPFRLPRWALPAGSAAAVALLLAVVAGIGPFAREVRNPPPPAGEVVAERPEGGDAASPLSPAAPASSSVNGGAAAASPPPAPAFLDARTTPSSTRAPLVRDPAGLPDFALFRECDGCPEMVVLPGGSFRMGSPAGEAGRSEDEDTVSGAGGSQVSVRVPRFAIARFETTWEEWEACVRAGACQQGPVDAAGGDNGWGRGRRPVIEVDWNDAGVFARFVNGRASVSAYRRPTEAEWEYAARAGTTSSYSWGNAVGRNNANCDGCGSQWDNQQTAPVGSFAGNAYGLYDLHGNVWEWVEDCYRDNLSAQTALAYTTGSCSSRVLRGGSRYGNPSWLRSANRGRDVLTARIDFGGFRLARTV